jgi:hypothetical protein
MTNKKRGEQKKQLRPGQEESTNLTLPDVSDR